MIGWIVLLAILAIYTVVLIKLYKRNKASKIPKEEQSITVWGPAIMMHTRRGKEFIDWMAKKTRFWALYGDICIALCVFMMITMFLFLCYSAYLWLVVPRDIVLTPQMLIGVPGLNPIIPIWYGIIGFSSSI